MRPALTTLALLLVPLLVLAQGQQTDFARGAEIRTDTGSIFRIVLPDDVYETVTRADLADVRVLNASGETVPHMLRRPPLPAATDADWVTAPSFPMGNEQTGRAGKTQVKIDASGAVLEVTGDAVTQRRTAAYLIDASAIDEPLKSIALTWTADPGVTFLTSVRVHGSADLNTWRPLVSSAALAQLQRDGFMLVQNEVELPADAGRTRYLRISWPGELSAVTLTTVRVRPRLAARELPITWRTLTGESDERAAEVRYDAGGRFPVEYLDLEFADASDAVDVGVFSRRTPDGEWIFRYAGLFYSLREGTSTLHSTPARVQNNGDRYWSIRRNAGTGAPAPAGFSRTPPRLRVGWHPHELVFVAKGAAPYTLVYGSARASAADAPVGALLTSLEQVERTLQLRDATVGPPRDLGGTAALSPPREMKQIVLWSALALAVALLGWIAVRTFRETGPRTTGT